MKQAIVIVDHGSRKKEANELLFKVRDLVRQKAGNQVIVHCAHMELAEPTMEQGITQCVNSGATHIIVHPYMLSPGRHATEDIPRIVKEIASSHPNVTFEVTSPLGVHPKIAEAVLDRCGLQHIAQKN